MRLSKDKNYAVEKYTVSGKENFGRGYNGKDVRAIIGKAKWSDVYGAFVGKNELYFVEEC